MNLSTLSRNYFILAVIYFSIELFRIKKNRCFELRNIAMLVYAFVYGIAYGCVYHSIDAGTFEKKEYIYNLGNIDRLFWFQLISVLVYLVLNMAMYLPYKKQPVRVDIFQKVFPKHFSSDGEFRIQYKIHMMCGIILLAISLVCILLWTSPYGSIMGYARAASKIRSGIDEIPNSFAYFSRIVPVSRCATYIFLLLFLQKRKDTSRVLIFVLFLASIALSLLYTLLTDSRISIGLFILGVVLILIDYGLLVKEIKFKKIVIIGVSVFAATIYLMVSSDKILYRFREDQKAPDPNEKTSISNSIVNETAYLPIGGQMVLDTWIDGDLPNKLGDDIINSIFKFIPSRFYPYDLPPSVWAHHTVQLATGGYHKGYGTQPTGLIEAGFYYGGLPGVFVLAYVLGTLLKLADYKIWRRGYKWNNLIIHYSLANVLMNLNFQMSSKAISLMPLVVYIVIEKICCIFVNGTYASGKKSGDVILTSKGMVNNE